MAEPLDDTFLKQINQNIGIANKVCNIYSNDTPERENLLQEMMDQLWK